MGIVCAEKKKDDRDTEEKLLRRCVLIAIVDLLPHIQVVIGARIEFERNPLNVVEHEVRSEHVGYVGQRPGCFLRDTGDDVVKYFENGD